MNITQRCYNQEYIDNKNRKVVVVRHMMDQETCLTILMNAGEIPLDAQVVSTNNKLVVVSESEQIVTRIGDAVGQITRDDPHNLTYSHRVAWLAGAVAPVVRPTEPEPTVSSGYVLSRYPLLGRNADLDTYPGPALYRTIDTFGSALDHIRAYISLRCLNVAAYVGERLDYMDGSSSFNQSLVGKLTDAVQSIQTRHPFQELTDHDPALVHGDVKTDNFVVDGTGELQLIDVDAAAIGPRLYDLGSWTLRSMVGDYQGVERAVDIGRQSGEWDEEVFLALVAWKAISSMSFTLRYDQPDTAEANFATLFANYQALEAKAS